MKWDGPQEMGKTLKFGRIDGWNRSDCRARKPQRVAEVTNKEENQWKSQILRNLFDGQTFDEIWAAPLETSTEKDKQV